MFLIYIGTSNAGGEILLFGVVAGNLSETGRHAIGASTTSKAYNGN